MGCPSQPRAVSQPGMSIERTPQQKSIDLPSSVTTAEVLSTLAVPRRERLEESFQQAAHWLLDDVLQP